MVGMLGERFKSFSVCPRDDRPKQEPQLENQEEDILGVGKEDPKRVLRI